MLVELSKIAKRIEFRNDKSYCDIVVFLPRVQAVLGLLNSHDVGFYEYRDHPGNYRVIRVEVDDLLE